jgi:hypothetical protein
LSDCIRCEVVWDEATRRRFVILSVRRIQQWLMMLEENSGIGTI